MFSQTSHTITAEKKNEAIALIKQAAEILGIPANLPIAGKNRQCMGQASSGYVQDCITAATTFPTVPSGEVDAQLMQQKYDAYLHFSEVNDVLGPFAINSINVARLHGQDLMVSGNSIKSSFNFAAKNRADLKPTSDKLNKRYKKAKQDEKDAKKAINGGSANGTEGSTPTEPAS